MKPRNFTTTTTTAIAIATLLFLLCLPSIASQSCQNTCGTQRIKYPFGTGPGCGDPRFQNYITCNHQNLSLTTHTGSYPITTIDYANQVIYISDPSMSTCTCTQPSKGFGLDYYAPFTFHDDTVFALLDCSTTTSPIYKSNGTKVPLCDNEGAPICSLLFSCRPISMIDIPISTCCVYTPVDLGPAFEMDLKKLKCSSYSGFYGLSEKDPNPENWKYGVALKYKFNVNNEYPSLCGECERTNGVCGYNGGDGSFACNCPGGTNTSLSCYYDGYWINGSKMMAWNTGAWLINLMAWYLIWSCRR